MLIFSFHSDFATSAFFDFHFNVSFFLIRDPSTLLPWGWGREGREKKEKDRRRNEKRKGRERAEREGRE